MLANCPSLWFRLPQPLLAALASPSPKLLPPGRMTHWLRSQIIHPLSLTWPVRCWTCVAPPFTALWQLAWFCTLVIPCRPTWYQLIPTGDPFHALPYLPPATPTCSARRQHP